MKLYHGTTGAVARASLTEGLKCRALTGVDSNWEQNPSAADRVYLTSVYAPYFAMCAQTDAIHDQEWGLIEVDTGKLNGWYLVPDEDYLEQVTRVMPVDGHQEFYGRLDKTARHALLRGDVKARTAWFRANVKHFGHMWTNSLAELGTCAILGSVPVEAITRVSLVRPINENASLVWCASDPHISLLNFSLMHDKYAVLTRWFMGYSVSMAEWWESMGAIAAMVEPTLNDAEAFESLLQNNPGVQVLT